MKENIDEIIKKMIGKCIEKKDEELLENFKNLKYDLGFSSINIMQLIYELRYYFRRRSRNRKIL